MSAVTLPAGWPEGKPLAVSVSVMLEGWTDDSAPGVGPMGNVLKAGVLDLQARSWAEYGPRVGAWRILDILAEAGVRAVFYVSGVLAERYPALMRAIADAGHSVAGHSWGQNIIPATQTAGGRGARPGALRNGADRDHRGGAAWLAEPALHPEQRHDRAAGRTWIWLARGFLRQRSAAGRGRPGPARSSLFRSPWR